MKTSKFNRDKCYKIFSVVVITIFAIAFFFPLYWIITGSFKTSAAINSTTPQWWPHEWVMDNYSRFRLPELYLQDRWYLQQYAGC